MATTTTLGYPIPDDSDPVADGALAVRDLGQAVNNRVGVIASGTTNVNLNGVTNNTANVTFPTGRFTGTPQVVACANVDKWNVSVGSAGPTGCQLRVRSIDDSTGGGNVPVDWIAIQQ